MKVSALETDHITFGTIEVLYDICACNVLNAEDIGSRASEQVVGFAYSDV